MLKTPQDRKEDQLQIVLDLQRSQAPEVKLVLRLIDSMFEDVKDLLVTSQGEFTLKYQGEARALRTLYKVMTQPPVPTKTKE